MDIFMKLSALQQALDGVIHFGTVVESKASEGKALCRVKIHERVTPLLPVQRIGNSVVKIWIPPLVGEQVIVLCPNGNTDSGVVLPSIFNTECREPKGANSANLIVEIGSVRIECDESQCSIISPSMITLDTPLVKMSGDLVVDGEISDSRGDLTGHTHDTTDGATAKER